MIAIVLSCDRYHDLAYHAILTYETLWPDNNFIFRVPWEKKFPQKIKDKFGDKVEFIKMNWPLTAPYFKKTINGLLRGLDEEEWVYWCIDDKYLVSIDSDKANKVMEFTKSTKAQNINGVTFGYARKVPKHLATNKLQYSDIQLIQRSKFINAWLHQFLRVKALREFFDFLKPEKTPKAYDRQLQGGVLTPCLDPGQGAELFTIDHEMAVWGESTTRGKLTKNCADSFKSYNLPLPKDFVVAIKRGLIFTSND